MSAPAWAVIGAAIGATLALLAMLLFRRQSALRDIAHDAATTRATPLPPETIDPDRSALWYYAQNGSTVGPYSFDQLQIMFHEGHLAPEDYVCCQKDQKWHQARTIRGLVL